MCPKRYGLRAKRNIAVFTLSLLIGSSAGGAREVALPRGNDARIYAAREQRLYDLRLKLRPRIIESRVCWRGKEEIDWKEEINNWHFGSFAGEENIPPLIIDRENFYPMEEGHSGRYCWGRNNMILRVFNPLNAKVVVSLSCSANSLEKRRTLKVLTNGQLHGTIEVPEKSRRFKIENISLDPGMNEIGFFCPQGATILKTEKGVSPRKVSIRFQDDIRFKIESRIPVLESRPEVQPRYGVKISKTGLDMLAYLDRNSQPVIVLSRDVQVSLEEYPCFDFVFSIRKSDFLTRLKVFLGVDYDEDGVIDDYLEFEKNNLADIDFSELASKKAKNLSYWAEGFTVRKIFLLGFREKKMIFREPARLEFRVEKFCFYNYAQTLYVPVSAVERRSWTVEECVGTTYKSTIPAKGLLTFDAYFDSRVLGTKADALVREREIYLKNGRRLIGEVIEETADIIRLKTTRELAGQEVTIKKEIIDHYFIIPRQSQKKTILEEEKVEISFNLDLSSSPDVFRLVYQLQDPSVQTITAFLDLDTNSDGVIDERILAGNRELLRGWKFIGSGADRDLYETYLSGKFPAEYTTEAGTGTRFVVCQGKRPLGPGREEEGEDPGVVEIGIGEPLRVVISVPRGRIPADDFYQIIYSPLPEGNPISGFEEYEAEISWLFRGEPQPDIKRVTVCLQRKKEVHLDQGKEGWYSFYLKAVGFGKKFVYPAKTRESDFLESLRETKVPLIRIDGDSVRLNDFSGWQSFADLEKRVLSKRIELARGQHKYEELENDTFDVKWAALKPVDPPLPESLHKESQLRRAGRGRMSPPRAEKTGRAPEIVFKRLNPTKYLVRIKDARSPFWLVFSESFHKQWRLYRTPKTEDRRPNLFDEIIADYPEVGVKEARHLMEFTLTDIGFLFKKPLAAAHYEVNGYANSWYIEPERLNLGTDFSLIIYFWPQSLFCLGLGISGATLGVCVIGLVGNRCRKKSIQS